MNDLAAIFADLRCANRARLALGLPPRELPRVSRRRPLADGRVERVLLEQVLS